MTHVTRWTSTDVADWLEQCLHLPGQSFREADIDGAKLLGLDEQQLHSLGLEDAQVARLQSHISAFRAVGPGKVQGSQGPVKLHLGAKPDPVCLTPRETGEKTRTHRTPRTRRTHSLERAKGVTESPATKTSKVRSSSLGSQPRIRSQARPAHPARQHVHSAPQELMEFSRQIRQLQADLRDKETAKILKQGRSRPSRPRSRPRSRARSSQSSPTKQTPRTPLTPQTPGPFGARERTQTPSQLDGATSFVPLKRGQEQYKFGPANRQKQGQKPPRPKLASQKVSPQAKTVPKTDELAAESVESVEQPEETPRLTGEELMPLALKIVEAAQQPEEVVEVKQPEEKPPLTGEELMPLALKIVEAAQHTEEPPEVKEPENVYLTGAELMPLALKIVETAMGKGDDPTSDLEDPKDVFNLLAELSQGLDGSELQISQEEAEEAWRQPSLELSSELEAVASQFGTTTMTPTATMSSVSMSPGRVSSKSSRPFNALKEYLPHPSCSCQKAAERAVPCLSHCGPTVKSHGSKGFKFSKVIRKEVRSVSPCNGVYTPRFRAHIPGGTFPTASRWQIENRANLLSVCNHVQPCATMCNHVQPMSSLHIFAHLCTMEGWALRCLEGRPLTHS